MLQNNRLLMFQILKIGSSMIFFQPIAEVTAREVVNTGESSHCDASNCIASGQDSDSVSEVPEPST